MATEALEVERYDGGRFDNAISQFVDCSAD